MTLDAETTLAAAAQVVAVHAAIVGVVASQTVHRLSVARVKGIIPDRMSEPLVLFVALGADIVAIDQHRHAIAAVQLVAVGTLIPTAMTVQIFFTSFESIGVTVAAQGADICRQQSRQIANMRIVTSDTGIAIAGDP